MRHPGNFKERERRWDEREKAKARERERDVERESRKAKTNAQRHTRTETDLVAEEQDVEEGRRGADRAVPPHSITITPNSWHWGVFRLRLRDFSVFMQHDSFPTLRISL